MQPNKKQKTHHDTIVEFKRSIKPKSRLLLTPDVPLIFGSYVKVILHTTCLLALLTLFFGIYMAVSKEINERFDQDVKFLENVISVCRQKYTGNHCSHPDLAPFLKPYCNEWKQCAERDPAMIGRAKIATRIFGELVNGLVESLTLKSMIGICLLAFGSFMLSSLAF
ncbi:Di-sulfide bridge nucleocytoplasmic transport domain-containing protein [Phycomyces blakesleeanus]|uniref:Di-sulfide bridge nucleocytoplasmic transport domain-containing protein n=1 Tax=Phycomyces blakesleeanus TaxID=4837 RepID=A0ABR3AJA7_PHYBL